MPSLSARAVRRVLRATVKPVDVDPDLVDVIRSATDGRPPPTIPVRGVSRRRIHPGELAGVTGERTSVATPRRTIVHLHGGYHVGGGPGLYRNLAARLAHRLDAEVLVLDLPLAPEHPYPAALSHAWTAYEALIDRADLTPTSVALSGDSAGGGLALAIAQRAVGGQAPSPGALVLLSPWLDLTGTASSLDRNDERDDMLSAAALRGAAALYAGTALDDPGVSPLHGSLTGLPPSLVTVDASETLLEDSLRFADLARAAGSRVELHRTEGLSHIWPVLVPFVREARRTVAEVVGFLDRTLT